MGQLTNQFVSSSYQGLLNLENANTGVTSTLQYVTDGIGNKLPMLASTSSIVITGSFRGDGSGLTGITSTNAVSASYSDYAVTSSYALNAVIPSGTVSGSAQISALGFATTSSLDTLSGSIATTDLGQNNRLTSLEQFTSSIDTGYVSEAEFGTYTSSMNNFTSSIDGRVDALEIETGSLQNQINGLATTGSLSGYTTVSTFNNYTSSNDTKVNDLISKTGSYATVTGQTALSSSIAVTDLSQNNRLTSIEQKTGSFATTGSNVFNGDQTITGSVNITGNISATSASFTYVTTTYETSSVIYSSGSNQFGDASNDTQTLYGTVKLPNGPLSVTGSVTASGGFTGNLTGTASYATNALSASEATHALTASYAENGNRNGLITTGSIGGSQHITGSVTIDNNGSQNDLIVGPASSSYSGRIIVNGTGSAVVTNAIFENSSTGVNQLQLGNNGNTTNLFLNGQTTMWNTFITGSNGLPGVDALTVSGSSNFIGGLNITGSIIPGDHNQFDLGSPSAQWRDLYLSSGSIYMDGHLLIDYQGESNTAIYSPQPTGSIELHNNLIVLSGATVNGNATVEGDLDVNGVLNASNITGSLQGTASFATNALSASEAQHAVSASWAPQPDISNFATTGSNNFVGDQTITGSVVVTFSGNTGDPLLEVNNTQYRIIPADNQDLQITTKNNGEVNMTIGDSSNYGNLNLVGGINQTAPHQISSTDVPNTLKLTDFQGNVNVSGSVGISGSTTINGLTQINNDVTINSTNPFGTFVNMISTGTTSFNMNSPLTQFQSNGDMVFKNTLSGVGTGSIRFDTDNGGDINFIANGTGAKIEFNSNNFNLNDFGGGYIPMSLSGPYSYFSNIVDSTAAPFAGHTIEDSTNSANNIGLVGAQISTRSNKYGAILYGGGTGSIEDPTSQNIMYAYDGNQVDFVKNVTVTGSLKATQGITGSLQGSSSFAVNAGMLDGYDSSAFATTGSNNFKGGQYITEGNGLTLAANIYNSGSAYPNVSSFVDQTTDPSNVYASYQLVDASTTAGFGIAKSSYTAEYGGQTVDIIVGGGSYGGSDTAMIFKDGVVNIPRPVQMRAGATITGSVNITGSLGIRSGSLSTISNNTTVNINNYITSSDAGQSNILYGWGENPGNAGASLTQANYTGSLRITGSNNLISMPQIRATALGGSADQQGYISGSGNMIMSNNAGIYLNTGSLLFPKIQNNYLGVNSVINMNFTTSSLAGGHPIVGNNIVQGGGLILNHPSGSANASTNVIIGGQLTSNQTFVTNVKPTFSANNILGAVTLNHISSSINFQTNYINATQFNINNHVSSSNITNNGVSFTNNLVFGGSGGQAINVYTSGSQSSNSNRIISDNIIGGRNIAVSSSFVSSSNSNLFSSLVVGNALTVSGSHIGGTNGGSVFLGRFNDTGSGLNLAQDIVMAVGTGTSASARKTGFYITSGSLVGVSGSMEVNGPLTITGSAGDLYMYGHKMFNVGAFQNSGSLTITSGSNTAVSYSTTDVSYGVNFSNSSRMNVVNAGVYNVQFSAQVVSNSGDADIWVWLVKNGTAISNTTGKVHLANNQSDIIAWNWVVEAAANDYYEIYWRTDNSNVVMYAEAAFDSVPGIPSIIATVTQVR